MKQRKIIVAFLICACVLTGIAGAFISSVGTPSDMSEDNNSDNGNTAIPTVSTNQSWNTDVVENSVYEEAAVKDMKKVAENEYLEMYLNETDTTVAIRDKQSNGLWFSNPVNEEEDTFSTAYYQKILKSQLYLTYIDENTKISTMNNYTSAIENGQFEIEEIENGLKITYFIADSSLMIPLPDAISEERMNKFLEAMSESQKKKINRNYTLYSMDSLKEEEADTLLEKYPALREQPLYILRSGTKDYMREELAEYFAEAGYTQADYEIDNKNLGDVDGGAPWFNVPMYYQLDEANLLVTVDPKEVEYNTNGYYLVNIDVLRYFGATLYEDGYLFVPDGSGALIYLNNGKTTEASYSAVVYGQDATMLYTSWYQSQVDAQNTIKMPVYGIKDGEKSVFAIIEEGDAYAAIKADVAGTLTGYNDVYASFAYLQYGATSLDDMVGAQSYYMYSDAEFEGTYKVRYSFLTGSSADYSGMASCYRSYLQENGVFTEKLQEEELPFFVEYIGAIDKPKTFLGIKYDAIESLTTFAQAKEITNLLKQSGVNNLNVIYSGWANDGLHGSAVTQLTVESKLKNGGMTLSKLQDFMEENAVDMYMTLDLQYVYEDGMFDGYTGIQYAPRYFDNTVIKINDYGMASRVSEGELASLISPYHIYQITNKLTAQLEKEGILGVNLGTLSWELFSDLQKTTYTDRQMAERENGKAMQSLQDANQSIIADNANAYVWRYVDELINVPMYSNGYRIIDEDIPFYEMVIHGYLSYSGEAANLTDDYETAILKCVEYGAGLNFKWIYEDNSLLKDSEYDYLYSVNYEVWLEQAIAVYQEMTNELGYLQSYEILSHEYLEEGVAKVGYEDGSQVYVNYTENAVEIDGIMIPAREYTVVKEAL